MSERIKAANGVALQRARLHPKTTSRARQRRFLEHLAATCNVTASAKVAGIAAQTIYRLRQRDPAFAAAWKDAIATGYDRLEEALLAKALAHVEPVAFDASAVQTMIVDEPPPADPAAEPTAADRRPGPRDSGSGVGGKVALVDVQLGLALLNRRHAAERDGRPRSGQRRATAEEVERAINAKLDKLAARIETPR